MIRIFKKSILLLLLANFTTIMMAHTFPAKDKTGILLVTFGTSYANAQKAYENIETKVKATFPDVKIRWAYTSNFIRKKLERQGITINSPAEALAQMADDGFTHIAVQSLHIIPGEEYENLEKTVSAFNHMPKNAEAVLLGKPLLYKHEDISEVMKSIERILPSERGAKDAVVMMGHGTEHASNIYYPGLQYYLWQESPLYFLGTVEGYPSLDDVIKELKATKVKTVWLMPFMSVAGDHAQNDMAGDEPDSWKSQLEANGYTVNVVLKGLAEYDAIVQIWIEHLNEVMKDMD